MELRGQEGEVPFTPAFNKMISNPPENAYSFDQGTITLDKFGLITEIFHFLCQFNFLFANQLVNSNHKVTLMKHIYSISLEH